VGWSKCITFFLEFHWSVEIFSFSYRSINVIFRIHHLEITLKISMQFLRFKSIGWFWVNWLSSVPIIFYTIIVIGEFFNSVGWCFDQVFVLVCVLPDSWFLIKELFKMCVIAMIIFWISNLCSVVPSLHMSASRHLNAFLKSIHYNL